MFAGQVHVGKVFTSNEMLSISTAIINFIRSLQKLDFFNYKNL